MEHLIANSLSNFRYRSLRMNLQATVYTRMKIFNVFFTWDEYVECTWFHIILTKKMILPVIFTEYRSWNLESGQIQLQNLNWHDFIPTYVSLWFFSWNRRRKHCLRRHWYIFEAVTLLLSTCDLTWLKGNLIPPFYHNF